VTFDHPWLLLALLVIPVAALLYLWAERRRARYAVNYTNLEVLASVAATTRPWRRYVAPVLLALALAALGLAVARPHVKTMVPLERATVILVVDSSGSMQATDVKPTRFGAAQDAVRTFLSRVPSRLAVGMIVFAGEPQVATPPTTDHELVRQAIDLFGNGAYSGFGGTAIGDALQAAVDLGVGNVTGDDPSGTGTTPDPTAPSQTTPGGQSTKPKPVPRGLVSILLLSDGKQTRGLLDPLDGARLAKDRGIRVYTVALGTPNGYLDRPFGGFGGTGGPTRIPVPPDPETLHAIATATGGEFFAAPSAQSAKAAYAKLGSRLGRRPGRSEVTWQFLVAGAALLLGAGVASALWAPRLL
jgi:Ca-activated chloride channel family protein